MPLKAARRLEVLVEAAFLPERLLLVEPQSRRSAQWLAALRAQQVARLVLRAMQFQVLSAA